MSKKTLTKQIEDLSIDVESWKKRAMDAAGDASLLREDGIKYRREIHEKKIVISVLCGAIEKLREI